MKLRRKPGRSLQPLEGVLASRIIWVNCIFVPSSGLISGVISHRFGRGCHVQRLMRTSRGCFVKTCLGHRSIGSYSAAGAISSDALVVLSITLHRQFDTLASATIGHVFIHWNIVERLALVES